MATPELLVHLRCPACNGGFWVIDSDWRGAAYVGEKELTYSQRDYTCRFCGRSGSGHAVITKSPPEFFLQPHQMYPMSASDFDHWATVLREHFPDHPKLSELGRSFFPTLPGTPTPTVEMWHEVPGQAPRCTLDPSLGQVREWLEHLGPDAQLKLEYQRGLKLTVRRGRLNAFDASCADSRAVIAEGTGLAQKRILEAVEHFLRGDGDGCLWAIAPAPGSAES